MVDLTGILQRNRIEEYREIDEVWDLDDEDDEDYDDYDDSDSNYSYEESIGEEIRGLYALGLGVSYSLESDDDYEEPIVRNSFLESIRVMRVLRPVFFRAIDFPHISSKVVSGVFAEYKCPVVLSATMNSVYCYNDALGCLLSPVLLDSLSKKHYEDLFRSFGFTQRFGSLGMALMVASYKQTQSRKSASFIAEYFPSNPSRMRCIGNQEKIIFQFDTKSKGTVRNHKIKLIQAGVWRGHLPFYVLVIKKCEKIIGIEGKYLNRFITTSSVSKTCRMSTLFSGLISHLVCRTYIWFICAAGTTLRKYFTYLLPT